MSLPYLQSLLPKARFAADERGAIAILAALTLTLMVGAVGGAVDFGRVYSARLETQAALDAAVLVAGRKLQVRDVTEGEAKSAAATFFDNNKSDWVSTTELDIQIADGTRITALASVRVPATLASILGVPYFDIAVRSSVQLAAGGGAGGNLEMAVALDVTGSMCDDGVGPCRSGTKLDALKEAAKDLVNIVVWEDQSKYTSKMALIPFSTMVRVGPNGGGSAIMTALTNLGPTWSGWLQICTAGSGSSGSETGGNWSCSASEPRYQASWKLAPCVTDRTGSAEFTDTRPGSAAWLNGHDGTLMPWAIDSTGAAPSSGVGATASDPSYQWNYNPTGTCYDVAEANEMTPLSSDRASLVGKIENLDAFGATSGALAAAISWYALSPEWSTIWPSASRPAAYGDLEIRDAGVPRLRKIAVLMSDGVFNTFRGWKDQSQQDVSNRAKQICTAMKAKGIEIYTVAFELDSLAPAQRAVAEDTLKTCGTDLQHFYNAFDAEQLKTAFRDIALKVSTMRLSE